MRPSSSTCSYYQEGAQSLPEMQRIAEAEEDRGLICLAKKLFLNVEAAFADARNTVSKLSDHAGGSAAIRSAGMYMRCASGRLTVTACSASAAGQQATRQLVAAVSPLQRALPNPTAPELWRRLDRLPKGPARMKPRSLDWPWEAVPGGRAGSRVCGRPLSAPKSPARLPRSL